jgi:hypothetical protein
MVNRLVQLALIVLCSQTLTGCAAAILGMPLTTTIAHHNILTVHNLSLLIFPVTRSELHMRRLTHGYFSLVH